MAFMTYDEEHHRLGIVPIAGEPKPKDLTNPGLVHLAFAWPDVPSLVANYVRLRDRKIYPRINVNHGLTCSFYHQDPDGNTVELVCDLLPPAEASALMYSEYYARNPAGLLMDPEEFREHVEHGLTADELVSTCKATEVDLPSLMTEMHRRLDMSAQEWDAQFELALATRV
jgi:hypothetical protein